MKLFHLIFVIASIIAGVMAVPGDVSFYRLHLYRILYNFLFYFLELYTRKL